MSPPPAPPHDTAARDTAARDMVAAGWGDPSRRHGLPEHALAWLDKQVGRGTPSRPVPLADIALPPPALPDGLRAALERAVGVDHVRDDHETRVLHAAGKSYLDLLAVRSGSLPAAPDAVVLPDGDGQVRAVLQACVDAGVAVVTFGGGTSVVGGVRPLPGRLSAVVSLDLRRMDRLLGVDPVSLTATFEPGIRGPAAEALLHAQGLTLGHFPQSYEHATLGGYAATRSAGQASSGYGRFDDLVVAAVVQTPAGELRLGRGAATAAGPDLLGLLVGSEGTLGVLTSVTVRVRRAPAVKHYEGVFFRSWAQGRAAFQLLEQEGRASGAMPDVARLSDPDETRVQLALAGGGGLKGGLGRAVLTVRGYRGGCLAVLGWEGSEAAVKARRSAAKPLLKQAGGFVVGTSVGDRWAAGRFDGPYLRDDLLDSGVLVETLETSATWSQLDQTRDAVRRALHDALAATAPVVMCHVSHVYPHGASLYFTVLARQDGHDPVGQWERAKRAASDAIATVDATITHHHAVGTDHRPWMEAEVGPLGLDVLRAVKATLDPAGILNPGKLIPDVTPKTGQED